MGMTKPFRCRSLLAAVALTAPLVVAGCNGDSLAGIPSAPTQATSAGAGVPPPPELAQWDEKWRAIQTRPQSVALADHWRVCEIKFRYRIYRDLFLCLDLIEQRSDKDAREQRYAPVIVDWMRAEAYAETKKILAPLNAKIAALRLATPPPSRSGGSSARSSSATARP